MNRTRWGCKLFANGLRAEMRRVQSPCVHLAARVVCEGELNHMFDATRNKSNVLFSLAASHLDDLFRAFGDKNLVIICDRQGGRGHYGPLLRLMFEDWALEIVSEVESRSEYRLVRKGHAIRHRVRGKSRGRLHGGGAGLHAQQISARIMMARFNAYWQREVPGVKPTAGYYTDGNRFLADIERRRRELGIADADLIRSR